MNFSRYYREAFDPNILVIILTNPEGKKKVTEEAKCNTLKKIAIVTKTTEQNL